MSVLPLVRRVFVLLWCAAVALHAQGGTDVIRGRVTSDSGRVVSGATVFVTRGPDRAFKQTTTDSAGRYLVNFENGTGDYLVAVTAVGLKSARRRVQRQGSERELIADFVLGSDVSTLAAVKVTASRPERAENYIGPMSPEAGASERWVDGVIGQLAPSQLGNLSALSGTMPGVTQGPGGISILGAGAESNLTTLNGMALPGGSLPRAARVDTRVTGATFDPIRGGFSGANTDVRLGAGSRNYQERNLFGTFDAPALQRTDAVGRALGAPYGSFRGSAGANGVLVRGFLSYNVAVDVSRSTSDPATLLSGSTTAFANAGVAADSVTRLLGVANAVGLRATGLGIPSSRTQSAYTWLGRLDDIRDTLNSHQLTSYASISRQGALGFGPLSAPSVGGEQRQRALGVQLQLTDFVGDGRRILTQTKVGVSSTSDDRTPYLALPGAAVLVRTDGTDNAGIHALDLGGNSALTARDTRWTAEASNLTMWNANGRRHTFKVFGWLRGDGLSQDGGADVLGRYSYNTIDDLAAGRPASFSRTLLQPVRTGTVWNAATAIAHQFSPKRGVTLLYGARVEAAGFGSSPAANPALESALGVASGVAPTLVHVSPRMGFSWLYSKAKNNGNGMSISNTGSFFRNATGVIRGGIGEFRDLLRPELLSESAARTGLAGSTLGLFCTGAAVPTPDWNAFFSDATSIPQRCADGSGILADAAPAATLIARDYDVPRSWRASLDWNSNFDWLLVRVNNLVSWDLSQASVRDANFAGVERFTLAGEGGRPVYVTPGAIDPRSGVASATESRLSSAYGRVGIRGSELRGYGGQSTITLAPDVFRMRGFLSRFYTSVSYTLQSSRRQYLGFDGSTAGDPRLREWAPSNADARHMFVVQGAYSQPKFGTLTLFARAQSGLPFTPQVQGDINGDGRGGDRAWVPGAVGTDPALAAQIATLRQNGSPTARACVGAFAGRIADRNGCRGPWTATLNAQWQPRMPKFLNRLRPSLFFENVLGGVDQLAHGADGLRGWGGAVTPDPVLLVPRGFDVNTRAFRYDVNQRFGETRPSRTTFRIPFRVTLDVSLRLTTDFDLQQLRLALEPVRVNRRWEPRSTDSLLSLYLQETSNIHTALIAESDSLFLTADQLKALRAAEDSFSTQVRTIYGNLARYLSQYVGKPATKAAVDSATAAKKAYWTAFWEQPEIAGAIVNPTQRDMMSLLKEMMSIPKPQRADSQWQFGNPVRLVAPTAAPASRTPPVPPPPIPPSR